MVSIQYSLCHIVTDKRLHIVYSVLTELPAILVLYRSSFWSGAFLIFIFAVSVWNGGGFYIEVFGRKCVFSFDRYG